MPTKKPLRVFYLITKSNFGGAQKYVYELAKEARGEGHEVVVACGGTGEAGAALGLLAEKLNNENVAVRPVKHFLRNMSPLNDFMSFFEVWSWLRKEKPDVLHASSSKAGGLGMLAGRLAGVKKLVFTSHGLTIDETWRPRWQQRLIYIGTWLTIALSHHTIVISNDNYNRVKKMPGLKNKVYLIKNGIAPIDLLDKKVARAKLGPPLPPSSVLIGGIGELHPNKNWASAIIALKDLPENIHLTIIGEGEERKQLERLIVHHNLTDRVHLVGYKDNAASYLKAFDIFVLPSKKEGLPYVLLEAALAELPIIASDLPGNRDIIETGENGLLVEPSPNLLSATVAMLYRDEGMRRRLGAAAKAKVAKEFSIRQMYEKTHTLYSSKILRASKRTGA